VWLDASVARLDELAERGQEQPGSPRAVDAGKDPLEPMQSLLDGAMLPANPGYRAVNHE
jgi:hypothetical protein